MSFSRQLVNRLPLPNGPPRARFYPPGKELPYKYHLQQLESDPTVLWLSDSSLPDKEPRQRYANGYTGLYSPGEKEQWKEFESVQSALDGLERVTDGLWEPYPFPLMHLVYPEKYTHGLGGKWEDGNFIQDIKWLLVRQQIMPEFFDIVIASLSLSYTEIGILSAIVSDDLPLTSGGPLKPCFEICYALFFARPDDINGNAFFNRASGNLTDMLWVVTGSLPSSNKTLMHRILDGREQVDRDALEDILKLHLYFCTMCTIGWNNYFSTLASRLESLIAAADLVAEDLISSKTPEIFEGYQKQIFELLDKTQRLEREIIKAVELLESNANTLSSIKDFFQTLKIDPLGLRFELQMESNIYSLRQYSKRAKYLEKRILFQTKSVSTLQHNTLAWRSNAMHEKSYIAASNQLKISFLSQNFMRAFGLAVMLFIPGIFTSTLFSSAFFLFGQGPSIQASSQIWIWGVIVILLSASTISLLLFSFHAQTAQSMWAPIKRYLQRDQKGPKRPNMVRTRTLDLEDGNRDE